jgi:aerobic-type carbon monoxide dehydrogenase small subunit (CoxS/CutS family)
MIALIVNGRSVEVDDDPRTPLLYVLAGYGGIAARRRSHQGGDGDLSIIEAGCRK